MNELNFNKKERVFRFFYYFSYYCKIYYSNLYYNN